MTNIWERQTTHAQFPTLVSESDVFEAMIQAAEIERNTEQTSFVDPYRIAIDGGHVLDHDTFSVVLPERQDGDLDGYFSRLEAQCAFDLGIQVAKVTRYSPLIWQRVRDFLQPFFTRAGLIPESIEVDLFLGKYEQTHFGVHRDADSTFTFGLRGEKQFRMWPLDFFKPEMAVEGWPTHIQEPYYREHREQGHVVTVQPGNLLYWPSSVWHVGESPVTWSVTLAVAMILKPDPYERIKAIISGLLPDPFQVVDADAYAEEALQNKDQLPPNLATALAEIRTTMNAELIDIHLCLDWLKQLTGHGLTATPPLLPACPLAEDQLLRVDPQHPVVWKGFSQDQYVIAANGYAGIFCLPDIGENLIGLLKELNQGVPVGLVVLLDRFGLKAELNATAVLEELYGWRVFV